MEKSYILGVDVGGSHISCAYVDKTTGKMLEKTLVECKIDSRGSIHDFVESLRSLFGQSISASDNCPYDGVGIAMPGPFDYERGISKIAGVQKFDALFGVNLKQLVRDVLGKKDLPVSTANDAGCFALGEYFSGAARQSKRTIVVTLGTGFGSTFLVDGTIQNIEGGGVPKDGFLYHIPFKDSIADDYFSTRWFVNTWKKNTGQEIKGAKEVADLAKQNDPQALAVFEEFSENLAQFIFPWIIEFKPDTFVLGGSISKAAPLFLNKLEQKLAIKGVENLKIRTCEWWNEAPIIGAAMNIQMNDVPASTQIEVDCEAIVTWIVDKKTVLIDGYAGVNWNWIVDILHKELSKKGKTVRWFFADAAMKSVEDMDLQKEESLQDWFYVEKLLQIQPDKSVEINIVVGCGAALTDWNASLMYIDLPKIKRKSLILLHADRKLLDSYKCDLLSRIDLFIR